MVDANTILCTDDAFYDKRIKYGGRGRIWEWEGGGVALPTLICGEEKNYRKVNNPI